MFIQNFEFCNLLFKYIFLSQYIFFGKESCTVNSILIFARKLKNKYITLIYYNERIIIIINIYIILENWYLYPIEQWNVSESVVNINITFFAKDVINMDIFYALNQFN